MGYAELRCGINDAMLLSFLSDVGQALSTGKQAAAAECWAILSVFLSDDAAMLLTEWLPGRPLSDGSSR
jgi:hypothetical protein